MYVFIQFLVDGLVTVKQLTVFFALCKVLL